VNVKPVQVKVSPIKANLERVMEVGDSALIADHETPPDYQADTANPDVDLVDLYTASSTTT
jgi:hypothetical protein